MKAVKLIAREDRATGELGLLVEGVRLMDYPMVANEGLLIAHDLLEHPNGVRSIGSVDDELEALGGVMWVRGQTGYLRPHSYHSVEDNLSADICELARCYHNGVDFKTPVPRTNRCDFDDQFEYAIRKGWRMAVRDMEGSGDIDRSRLHEFRRAALHYMRKGVVKTRRRFARYSQGAVNSTYWRIAEAVDQVIRGVEYEGQEFVLRYDIDRCTAQAGELYEPEW